MKLFKPLDDIKNFSQERLKIFLAGSIEMGKAKNWHDIVQKSIENAEVDVYNPRRDDWDDSWVQSVNNENFKQQVIWEQKGLSISDIVFFYFQEDTKSPISLLEFGQIIWSDKEIIICVEPKFWRRGNIEVLCDSFNIPLHDNLDDAILELKECILN